MEKHRLESEIAVESVNRQLCYTGEALVFIVQFSSAQALILTLVAVKQSTSHKVRRFCLPSDQYIRVLLGHPTIPTETIISLVGPLVYFIPL